MRLGEVEEVGRRERGLERASRSEGAGQPQVARIWLRSVIDPDRLFHDQPGSIPPSESYTPPLPLTGAHQYRRRSSFYITSTVLTRVRVCFST